MTQLYDKTNPESIEAYGKQLIGKTFGDLVVADFVAESETEYMAGHESRKRKGGLGELVEECHFHYKANNDQNPDFAEAGVELKVTPYKIGKKGELTAKERLIITMIDYFSIINETFETSHVRDKSRLILLVYYLYEQALERLDYHIDYVQLFSPPPQDLQIMQHDFEIIQEKVKAGKAHELSEADTMYLGAATKAATSADRRKQPFSDEPAKPRAFSFKNSYMTYVLNHYIVPGKQTWQSEQIMPADTTLSFERYVTGKIQKYRGWDVDDICTELQIDFVRRPKDWGALLAYRILGIRGNKAEEFEKANIAVKTIRIGENKKIKEHMSFPTFRFTELVEQQWEDSDFGNYLRETRFFFVVYQATGKDKWKLQGCQFWNIPYQDLEGDVRRVWERTRQTILDGVQLTTKNGITTNNLPKQTENRVSHVRPHGRDKNDTYDLPDGRKMTKQCFWLNNSYILEQLDEELKK